MENFDLIVIGAGPAGYTGAIRATQLGMKVAVIEQTETLGGTCLNVGCIPSKALLNFSEKFDYAKNHLKDIGVNANVKLDLNKMLAKKDQIVSELCQGIKGLFAKNKITRFHGIASLESENIVNIKTKTCDSKKIQGKNILIATGSQIIQLAGVTIDEKLIISSTGALSLEKVPGSMLVIGGGYIGLELGSVWRRLGSKVSVVEFADTIVPAMDKEVRTSLHKILTKQGMNINLSTKVIGTKIKSNKVHVTLQKVGSDETYEEVFDTVLVSVGRKANTSNLALEKANISTDEYGRIKVNDKYQTNSNNIYAVGDVIAGPMLAHKAEEEAVNAVEIMNNQAGHVNYELIPSVIYTSPEVASVGATEEQLKATNIKYKVGKFPFLANSRARAVGETEGMVKILADHKTDRILGAHIVGADAGNLIGEIVAYMEFGGAAEDIMRTCHAHPTLSEAIKEAALATDKRTINM